MMPILSCIKRLLTTATFICHRYDDCQIMILFFHFFPTFISWHSPVRKRYPFLPIYLFILVFIYQ